MGNKKSWLAIGLVALLAFAVGFVFIGCAPVERKKETADTKQEMAFEEKNGPSPETKADLQTNEAGNNEKNPDVTPGENKPVTPEIQLQESQDATEKQLRLAASIFKIDLEKGIKSDRVLTIPPYGTEVRDIKTADDKSLQIDTKTGELLSYYSISIDNVPANLTKDDAIPKEEAMAKARDLLEKLGVDAVFEDEKTQYQDSIEVTPNDLQGAEWDMRGILKWKGIPFFGSGVKVSVSAYSGEVVFYAYRPVGPAPDNLDAKIKSAQAREAVSAFLANKTSGRASMEIKGEPLLVITYPNNFWTRTNPGPLTPADKPRLCWLVDSQPEDGGSPLLVYVDAQTGEIVGGMG